MPLNVHNAREVVSEHVQRHLGGHLRKAIHYKITSQLVASGHLDALSLGSMPGSLVPQFRSKKWGVIVTSFHCRRHRDTPYQ
jgi:hypothetical protein